MKRLFPHVALEIPELCKELTWQAGGLGGQAWNSTFTATPPLDAASFTSGFALQLDGFIDVQNNTELKWGSKDTDPSLYNKYRVCVRYSGVARVFFNGTVFFQRQASHFREHRLTAPGNPQPGAYACLTGL